MKIELFYTPGCEKCADARDGLRATAEEVIPDVTWRGKPMRGKRAKITA
jgi:thioredoxin 1